MVTIPTLNQLYNTYLTTLQTQYGITISPIGKVFLRALAATEAAITKLQYLAIANLQKNIFVDTADPEALGGTLERFGRVKINRNPFAAVAAQYSIQLAGAAGVIIPQSQTWSSDASSLNPGMIFILDNSYKMVSTNDKITVRALTAGTISALNILDTLTANSPVANLNASVYVASQVVQPLDAEDIEIYRQAVINSFQLSPNGGSAADYRLWAEDAQGIVKVYPYASNGNINQIDLYAEASISASTDRKGTPSAALLSSLQSVIEFNPNTGLTLLQRGRRPLGVWQVNYLPVTITNVDITITGFAGLTGAIQAQLLAAITAAINLVRPFVAAADILANKNDILSNNSLVAMIVTSQPGAVFTSTTILINGTAQGTYQFTKGFIPYLRSLTFN